MRRIYLVLPLILFLTACWFLYSADWFRYLWIFPLGAGAQLFFTWAISCCIFVLSAQFRYEWPSALVSIAATVVFMRMQQASGLAFSFVAFALSVWIMQFAKRRLAILCWLAALVYFVKIGHFSEYMHPGYAKLLQDYSLAKKFLSIFYFFKLTVFGINIFFRDEKYSFSETINYFLAPPFWLSPGHGFEVIQTQFTRLAEFQFGDLLKGTQWLLQGLAFNVAFTLLLEAASKYLLGMFMNGKIPLISIMQSGVIIFALGYFEKARGTYIVSGFFRLSGYNTVPDFRAPWLSRSMMDSWRRFHFWVQEFYIDVFFQPLLFILQKRMNVQIAVGLAIFFTFSIGTAISHYIFYPGSLESAIMLALCFGGATLIHYICATLFKKYFPNTIWKERLSWMLGIPITWATVAFLYVISYPIFGLGWEFKSVLHAVFG